jgi:hypothetical protein
VVPVDRTENRKMVKKKGARKKGVGVPKRLHRHGVSRVKKRKKKNGEGEQTGNPGPRMAP